MPIFGSGVVNPADELLGQLLEQVGLRQGGVAPDGSPNAPSPVQRSVAGVPASDVTDASVAAGQAENAAFAREQGGDTVLPTPDEALKSINAEKRKGKKPNWADILAVAFAGMGDIGMAKAGKRSNKGQQAVGRITDARNREEDRFEADRDKRRQAEQRRGALALRQREREEDRAERKNATADALIQRDKDHRQGLKEAAGAYNIDITDGMTNSEIIGKTKEFERNFLKQGDAIAVMSMPGVADDEELSERLASGDFSAVPEALALSAKFSNSQRTAKEKENAKETIFAVRTEVRAIRQKALTDIQGVTDLRELKRIRDRFRRDVEESVQIAGGFMSDAEKHSIIMDAMRSFGIDANDAGLTFNKPQQQPGPSGSILGIPSGAIPGVLGAADRARGVLGNEADLFGNVGVDIMNPPNSQVGIGRILADLMQVLGGNSDKQQAP